MDSDDQSSGSYASEEESSVASAVLGDADIFERDLPRIINNDPNVRDLRVHGGYDIFQNITNEDLEDIGLDISNNTYLKRLNIMEDALDDEKLESLFRGLTRSNSIVKLQLRNNEFSAAGLRSLEPFLHNSVNLRELEVSFTNIQTEGFNILMQALHDKPIERLYFCDCGITSIEIETVPNNLRLLALSRNHFQSEGFNRLLRSLRDSSVTELSCANCSIESIDIVNDSFPRKLRILTLPSNKINTNGCRGIAKLLQEGGITLEKLFLRNNLIDDEGIAILVDALKSNTSVKFLNLVENNGISRNGRILILKMLIDISSIRATLRSNHTLQTILIGKMNDDIYNYTYLATTTNSDYSDRVGRENVMCHIKMATTTNSDYSVTAGREKVIQTQLHSKRRAKLATIQGVQHSLYSEIKPLHLPEVLSLVGRRHGRKELYAALKESIAELLSTVNKRLCLQRRRAHYLAMVEEIDSELAVMDSVEGDRADSNETRGIKRLRA